MIIKQLLISGLFFSTLLFPAADQKLVKKALRIHQRVLTVDTHCDTPFMLLEQDWDIGKYHQPGQSGSGCQDLPRMKEGGLDASFFAVFVGQGARSDDGHAKAKEKAISIMDAMDTMFAKYPNLCSLALTPQDAWRLEKEAKRAVFIGMENGYPLGHDITLLDYFYKHGVRYITLAHTADNDICDSATDRKNPDDNALSDWGRQVLRRMNELGIMIDVSHISDRSFFEVLNLSGAPVLASHSCARALSNSPRNLSDEMLLALKKNGGVIQLCILNDYIKQPPPNADRDKAFNDFYRKIDETYGGWGGIKDKAVHDKVEEEYNACLLYTSDAADE